MLPPEICQIILQYSVLVTDFLDPDHILDRLPPWVINSRGWSNSTEYSRTESTINTLRRVCRSWEEYLRPYVHRFVRMPDVVHGFVPAERLRSAMRISLGDHGGSYCSACKPEQFSLVGVAIPEENHHEQYWELCRQIIVHEQPLKTEILDYGLYGRHILEKLVSRRTFPRLAHIQAMWQTIPTLQIIEIMESLPLFRHMFTLWHWNLHDRLSLESSTLTTLILSFDAPRAFTEDNIQLPALRHLHIQSILYNSPTMDEEPVWLALLKIVGKGLRTFYLTSYEHSVREVSEEIWSICPKVEDLCLSWQQVIPPPPPTEHPIHTLGIEGSRITSKIILQEHLPDWPNLRIMRMNTYWYDWWQSDCGPLTSSQLEWLGVRLRLEDARGESYEEYVSRVRSVGGAMGSVD